MVDFKEMAKFTNRKPRAKAINSPKVWKAERRRAQELLLLASAPAKPWWKRAVQLNLINNSGVGIQEPVKH